MTSTGNETPRGMISSFFTISGRDFDPNPLSELIGLEPSDVWHRTNPWLENRDDLPKIAWEYSLSKRPHWSIDDAIHEVLNIFSPKADQIRAFASEHKCTIHLSLTLHADGTIIIYEIDSNTMALLAELGCSLSFHVDPLIDAACTDKMQ